MTHFEIPSLSELMTRGARVSSFRPPALKGKSGGILFCLLVKNAGKVATPEALGRALAVQLVNLVLFDSEYHFTVGELRLLFEWVGDPRILALFVPDDLPDRGEVIGRVGLALLSSLESLGLRSALSL